MIISEHAPTSGNAIAPSMQADVNPLDMQKILESTLLNNSPSSIRSMQFQKREEVTWFDSPVLPQWLEQVSYDRMGYAHFFVVAATKLEEFNRSTGYKLTDGGIMLIPSPQTEESETSYQLDEVNGDGFQRRIDGLVQSHSKDKQFDFSSCRFVPQALEIQNDKMLNDISTETDLRKLYAEKLERLEEQDSKRIAEIEGTHRREYRKLEQELEKASKNKNATEDSSKRQQSRLLQLNTDIASLVNRLEIAKDRPAKPSGVCDWASQNFADRMFIHERAQRAMKAIQNEEIDINLLCDSLEYLANEYWDMQCGNIDDNECQRLCSLFYNRPFEVVSNSDRSMRDYSDDYTISYKKKNTLLTQHLKVGKDPMRLVRIYFFFDKAEQKFVVGSMPKHLRIASYQ